MTGSEFLWFILYLIALILIGWLVYFAGYNEGWKNGYDTASKKALSFVNCHNLMLILKSVLEKKDNDNARHD